ncbi:phage integrase SAM-like domain-containing protein [Rufibacter roseus]|uniref:Phage integrase SAM-like domain-containing protein n=1 Tax=Rufibacter roseus TaxID=1567108 RepID=A0ABW2DNS6_9BACT|nr:phage integrase SAM-like domain-containing protein [Rufibacter roseus]
MEIKFYPKIEKEPDGSIKTNAKGMVSLQMVIHHNGERKKIGTGESVFLHLWDKEEERVDRKHHPDAAKINAKLNKLIVWAEEGEGKVRARDGYATVSQIAEYIKQQSKPWKYKEQAQGKQELKRDLESLYEHWKEVNKDYLTAESLRKYHQVVNQMTTHKPKVTIDDIDEAFMRKYAAALAKQKLKSGTVQKHYQFVKEMRALAGLPSKEKWLVHKTQYSPQLDLTADEFIKLINAWLPTEGLSRERDMWVLQAFLGLRPGDFAKVKPHHRKSVKIADHGEVQVMEIDQGKTMNPVQIPLPPLAVRIWDKYEGNFILPTQQERGRYIKKVATAAGLNRMYVRRDLIGGKVKETFIPVDKAISPYTARHTAASLVYEGSGGDDSLAGWLLGHAQHGIKGTTGVYAKDKAARVLPKILAAWEAILGDRVKWPG